MKNSNILVSVLGLVASFGLACGDDGGSANETSDGTGTGTGPSDDDVVDDDDDDDDETGSQTTSGASDDDGSDSPTGNDDTTDDGSGDGSGSDSTGECPTEQLLLDPGFEDGTETVWEQGSEQFGSPLCDGSCFGMGAMTAAYEGEWWIWFGGIDEAESAFVSQEVTIPDGFATLSFYLFVPTPPIDGEDFFRVEIDGDVLFEITDLDGADYARDYVQVVLDVSSYADGEAHTVRLSSENPEHLDETTNFFVDLVELSTACEGDPTDTGTETGTETGDETTGTTTDTDTSGTTGTGGTESTGAEAEATSAAE